MAHSERCSGAKVIVSAGRRGGEADPVALVRDGPRFTGVTGAGVVDIGPDDLPSEKWRPAATDSATDREGPRRFIQGGAWRR